METLEERYFELFKMFNRIVEKMDFVSVSKAEFFLLVQIHRQVQVQEVSTVRTLAQDMGVSSPAVSRMIRSLSEKNMAEKRDLSSDRRNTSITLTERGIETLRENSGRIQRVRRYYTLCVVQLLLSWFLIDHILTFISYRTIRKCIIDTCLFIISFQIQREWVFRK